MENDIIESYFTKAAELKPGEFILIHDGEILEDLVQGEFSKDYPTTICISDKHEIFCGDILIYPKTQQFCMIDDIRHYFGEGEGYYLMHYHTPQMFPPPHGHHHGEGHCHNHEHKGGHCCHHQED